jgi:hypothetical protein
LIDMNKVWASRWLMLAAVYNLLWGAWVVLRPYDIFDLTGTVRPLYPGIWQCVGMIVGVYGIGYGLAARDPFRHWPIVVVGLLGKLFGPLGFVTTQFAEPIEGVAVLPLSWAWTLVTNDLIWWIPFSMILYAAFKDQTAPSENSESLTVSGANARFRSNTGETLQQLSDKQPVLLIFLRHTGCTFCREALDDLRTQRKSLADAGVQPVLVHMGSHDATEPFRQYGVEDVPRISDPNRELYRAYELRRATWYQIMAPIVWWRGFTAAILKRHGVGQLVGDGFQMPGVFLIRNGQIIRSVRHEKASDRIDYCSAL